MEMGLSRSRYSVLALQGKSCRCFDKSPGVDDEDGKYRNPMRFSAIQSSLGITSIINASLHLYTCLSTKPFSITHYKTYSSFFILYLACCLSWVEETNHWIQSTASTYSHTSSENILQLHIFFVGWI